MDVSGYPWVLDALGGIFQYDGSLWLSHKGEASEIALGPGGTIWTLSVYGTPKQLTVYEQIYLVESSQTSKSGFNGHSRLLQNQKTGFEPDQAAAGSTCAVTTEPAW